MGKFDFEIGEKVRCVDNSRMEHGVLAVGQIYTVKHNNRGDFGGLIELEEVQEEGKIAGAFHPWRFAKI